MAKKEKVKKPFFKRIWFWVLAIIVIIAVAGNMGGEDTASTDHNEAQASEKSSNTSEKKNSSDEKKNEEKIAKLGEKVEVGKMTYTIKDTSIKDQVGPSALPTQANGKYLVLNVSVKNNGNEAVTVDGSYFKLMQGEKTFEADTSASMSANQGEDGTIQNSFFMEQLNPGSEMSGKVVFDVAPDIANSKELVVQAQEGIFGSVTKKISLGK
ncbi:DUF4352 domain-containing protein [Halobacillus salinarum]|uniref:DUF4352 domain-containing protein n=1 Tax=Halobacillus salinarum TaxID=2932257 RepID=A0ABY4EJT0_9BACI|nr:DUF4352 domain-containing protein [Halobacillus salinarum]UOQ44722.1 DUF4352 domain-containing protein [Halobacillus salinarum]